MRNIPKSRRPLPKGGTAKFQYLWDYYKLPIAAACILLYIIGYFSYRQLTRKHILLYLGAVNVATGEDLTERLTSGYLSYAGAAPKSEQITYYSGWYLTDDTSSPNYGYTYASQMKILASIDDESLDLVLMDREAFDAFSQNGYLCNLEVLLSDCTTFSDSLLSRISSHLIPNLEIIEDNAKEAVLDSSEEYRASIEEYPMAIDLSGTFLFGPDYFADTVYLGILKNSPRKKQVENYLGYLFDSPF